MSNIFRGRSVVFSIFTLSLICALILPLYYMLYGKLARAARAVAEIEGQIEEGKEPRPKSGALIKCTNGEWVVIDLHHESDGFVLGYTSKRNAYIAANAPYPAYEPWAAAVFFRKFESLDDFFKYTDSLEYKWLEFKDGEIVE